MRKVNNKVLKLEDEKSLMQFLREPTVKIAEAITGILASEKRDWKLSAGKLVQATIKGNLLTQLGKEIERYQEEGKIKEDYFATHKSRASLYELLKFLDEKVPDEELFSAIKSIFFSGVSSNASEQDEVLAYEFLQTAKNLTGTEVLILRANIDLMHGKKSSSITEEQLKVARSDRATWRRIIARQMGYGDMSSIVAKYEMNLELHGLISPRADNPSFQSDFLPTQNLRLTEMGLKFCEFITNYE